MKQLRRIGPVTISAVCDERLGPQLEWLLNKIADFAKRQNQKLNDGAKIQVGWSILTLRQQDGELVLCEPNFARNTLTEVEPDLTTTLFVMKQQGKVLAQYQIATPNFTLYNQQVVVAKGCLEQEQIYLYRAQPQQEASGWYIAALDTPAAEQEYELLFVYQVMRKRLELLSAMALPIGSTAVFDGGDLANVVL